ncbi:MAG: hypothetical protein K6G26_00800 [Lachnospiraceae bacterium]|nr:hypothetical protein [Lachnospiraceae bacterium]
MSTLLTGSLSLISRVFCEQLAKDDEVIIFGKNVDRLCGDKITAYEDADYSSDNSKDMIMEESYDNDDLLEYSDYLLKCQKGKHKNVIKKKIKVNKDIDLCDIISAYDIDSLLYISCSLDGKKRLYNELENLESVLFNSTNSNVKNFFYITTNDYMCNDIDESNDEKLSARNVVLNACDELCKTFCAKHNLNMTVLKIPYIFDNAEGKSRINKWIYNAIIKQKVKVSGAKDQVTDFISLKDVASILVRMINEQQEGYRCFYISGSNTINFEKICKEIKRSIKSNNIDVNYSRYNDAIPVSYEDVLEHMEEKQQKIFKDNNNLRDLYGWYPKDDVINYINRVVPQIKQNIDEITGRLKSVSRRNSIKNITSYFKVFGYWICVEILSYFMKNHLGINYIDLRFVFVTLCSILYGGRISLFSAALSTIGFIYEKDYYIEPGILIYNIGNWCNIAAYLLAALIPRYCIKKKDDEIDNLKMQNEDLEEKFIFINDLYAKAIESKEKFKKQIIGFNDSYGKIYDAVKKLNRSNPERVMYEAVITLEEFLECKSVIFYKFDEKRKYGRNVASSKEINAEHNYSIDLENYKDILEVLEEEEYYVNTDCTEGYPSYASAIKKDNKLVGMIVLQDVDTDNMNYEYANKFQILTGLINTSLVRALDKYEMLEKISVIPGTPIVEYSTFKDIVYVKDKMKKEGIADYYIYDLNEERDNIIKLSDKINDVIRSEDIIGEKEDGSICILLSQTDEEHINEVKDRIIEKLAI